MAVLAEFCKWVKYLDVQQWADSVSVETLVTGPAVPAASMKKNGDGSPLADSLSDRVLVHMGGPSPVGLLCLVLAVVKGV